MHARAPSIVLVLRDVASDRALLVAAFLSREPLSRGWNYTPCGQREVPKDRVQRSHLSVLCDSTAKAPAEPELDP